MNFFKAAILGAAICTVFALVHPGPASAQSMSVTEIQVALSGLGYDPGPVDGVMGQKTRDALTSFAKSHGESYNNGVSPRILYLLDVSYTMSQSNEGFDPNK